MTSRATQPTARSLRAHVIRVISLNDQLPPVSRFAVLAADPGAAMAAVVAGLSLCDVAEATDEVLGTDEARTLALQPGRPHRLL